MFLSTCTCTEVSFECDHSTCTYTQVPNNVLNVLVVLKVLLSTLKYVSTSIIVNTYIHYHTQSHKHAHKRPNKQLSLVQTMYKIIYMAAEPTYVAAEPEFQESTSYV